VTAVSPGSASLDCHQAAEGEADAFQHMGRRIATIVTPKDCGTCHAGEEREFSASHHAKAAQFIGSLDNILGEIVEGRLAAVNGCWQCHGSTVAMLKDAAGNAKKDASGKPVIGQPPAHRHRRVSLDGSRDLLGLPSRRVQQGDVAPARGAGNAHRTRPPADQRVRGVKHGIAFRTRLDGMNLKKDSGCRRGYMPRPAPPVTCRPPEATGHPTTIRAAPGRCV
jgi:hypothetical protein